jgi:hypothetical protein
MAQSFFRCSLFPILKYFRHSCNKFRTIFFKISTVPSAALFKKHQNLFKTGAAIDGCAKDCHATGSAVGQDAEYEASTSTQGNQEGSVNCFLNILML